jgi:hypothetical protein
MELGLTKFSGCGLEKEMFLKLRRYRPEQVYSEGTSRAALQWINERDDPKRTLLERFFPRLTGGPVSRVNGRLPLRG